MDSIDLLFVSPYKSLTKVAKCVLKKTNIKYSIINNNLDENIDSVKEILKKEVKVIISRGGTAQLLKERFKIPIIEIPVTSIDILNAINKIRLKESKKIAIITTGNIILHTEQVTLFKDYSVDFIPIAKATEIKDIIKKIAVQGSYDAVIGDVVSFNTAKSLGLYAELLESSENSIELALNECNKVLNAILMGKAKIKQMETILNYTGIGVLTIDKNGIIKFLNNKIEEIFNMSKNSILNNKIDEALPCCKLGNVINFKKEEKNILLDINNNKYVIDRIPIIIDNSFQGAIAIMQEVDTIKKTELELRKKLSKNGLIAKHTFNDFVGESDIIMKTLSKTLVFAKSDATILIYGETGTGKELIAQGIHNASKRKEGPFVAVNCTAFNDNLLESELFGYADGAFTGAVKGGKAGIFEVAHGGTLFLDEIGETSLSFQVKLLRVLQEKEIRRVGGDSIIPIDVRIICATNTNITDMIQNESFRKDLYYRLSVLEINLPPLRKRKDDIVMLIKHFINLESYKYRRKLYWDNDETFEDLLNYDWPGNVRELQNFAERIVISVIGDKVSKKYITEIISEKIKNNNKGTNEITIKVTSNIKDMESKLWKELLSNYNSNKSSLCKEFNISKSTLWRKLNNK